MQVLLEAQAAAPERTLAVAQEALVEVFDGIREDVGELLRAVGADVGEPLQQGGGEDGR